tara:strand:+ start:6522 stop:6872 length:351 start_codon:yes stop_codon:yes gene_type:complete
MGFLRTGRVHKLTKDNLARVPNSAGNYKLYDKNRKPVYVGTTAGNVGAKWGKKDDQRYRYGLRHRLGSYRQEDDYKEHPTKKALRPKYFSYKSIRNDNTRRAAEKRDKQGMRHNHL